MLRQLSIILCALLFSKSACVQQFTFVPPEILIGNSIQFREIITTKSGRMFIATSAGLGHWDGDQFGINAPMGAMRNDKGGRKIERQTPNIYWDLYDLRVGLKLFAEGPDKIIYLVSDRNNLGWMDYKKGEAIAAPPFNFPGHQKIEITRIWFDKRGDLFIGTTNDTLYIVKQAYQVYDEKGKWNYDFGFDGDSNWIVKKGVKTIEKRFLGHGVIPFCFAQHDLFDHIVMGTNKGLYEYDKRTGQIVDLLKSIKHEVTGVTSIDLNYFPNIWFSTTTKGMALYGTLFEVVEYFPYAKTGNSNSISCFHPLSKNQFLVAVADSLPAIFFPETGRYQFINDTSFYKTKNTTQDIKTGIGGVTMIIKGNGLFLSDEFKPAILTNNSLYPAEPFIKEIEINGLSYREKRQYYDRYDSLKIIELDYNESKLDIWFASRGFTDNDSVTYSWKLEGYSKDWVELPFSMFGDKTNSAGFDDLKAGKYIFKLRVKKGNDEWLANQVNISIKVNPPFWQTWWFWVSVVAGVALITYSITSLRARVVRRQEREKARHEKELLEMEARAMRAQMNPHFIFNCLNSIKSLMQQRDTEKGVNYLTTFSKLIRTLFQNSDKRQISLYDEIETCRLYLQLETMRLGGQLNYEFEIDRNLDLKSVMVPPLIIQPFIENAIWHGIVPKEQDGEIRVRVKGNDHTVYCEVDDDGIGRERSKLNKPITHVFHESKGVHLSQARLNLEKTLSETNASIEIIDKYDDGQAKGTKVILTFTDLS